jgi:hypothetical protein
MRHPNPDPKRHRMTPTTTEEASVTIQTLRIGPKKLTAAFYRQLDAQAIIDPNTGELRGRPWGRVNLHTAACKKRFTRGAHVHVVWQNDAGELRRAEGCIPAPIVPTHARSRDLLTLLLADGWRPNTWRPGSRASCLVELGDGLPALRCDLDPALPRAVMTEPDHPELAAKAAGLGTTAEALAAEVRAGVAEQLAAQDLARSSWTQLAALPLLIAGV